MREPMTRALRTETAIPLLDELNVIRKNIAGAMIGRTVDLIGKGRKLRHGIVTGVLVEAGMPKIVVGGSSYDLDRVLTVTA